MLKQRLITAAILIPLVVLGILKLQTDTLEWFVALVAAFAAWEWFGIIGLEDITKRLIWVSGLCLFFLISPPVFQSAGANSVIRRGRFPYFS